MAIKTSKIDIVIKLVSRKNGASLEKIQETTGWQPHSVRAALSRLRKKGHHIKHGADGKGKAIYRFVAED